MIVILGDQRLKQRIPKKMLGHGRDMHHATRFLSRIIFVFTIEKHVLRMCKLGTVL